MAVHGATGTFGTQLAPPGTGAVRVNVRDRGQAVRHARHVDERRRRGEVALPDVPLGLEHVHLGLRHEDHRARRGRPAVAGTSPTSGSGRSRSSTIPSLTE